MEGLIGFQCADGWEVIDVTFDQAVAQLHWSAVGIGSSGGG